MTAIPDPENSIEALIDKSMPQDLPRAHLGASQIGHPCDRWLWLSFRWAIQEKFSGRMLRLFRRGQLEEAIIVSDLERIGVHVQETGKNQSRVDFGKHFGGSIDGIVSNVPGGGNKIHVLECKTHGDKSFSDLVKTGSVQKSKSMHWAQMQVYMLGKKIDRALYVAVNKNDDRIYTERVKLNKEAAQKYIDRAHRITMSERMPEPISNDSTWYQCRLCAAHEFCFSSHLTKEINCRTCANVTPCENSAWYCARHDAGDIPVEFQRTGCECHVLHPDLVPWKQMDSTNQWEAVYEINGVPVRNGEGDAYTFASSELLANASACARIASGKDKDLAQLRTEMGGRIIE
jgi:hypothetical protein